MDTVIGKVEEAYDSFGLLRGDGAPMKRFVFTGLATYGLVFLAKPKSMFLDDGTPRPWTLLNSEDPNATTVPHYIVPILAGFVGGFLI